MDELFKKTNEFLVEFEKILNKEFEKNEPTTLAAHEAYDYLREWDYLFEELWEKESKYYLFGARHQYQNTRNYELKELNDKGVYFRFCKFKVYEKTYKERLNKFQEIYEDAQEISFLEDELKGYSNPIDSEEPFKYLDLKQKKDLTFTRKRTVDFLVQQAKTTGYNIIVSGDESLEVTKFVQKDFFDEFIRSSKKKIKFLNSLPPVKKSATEIKIDRVKEKKPITVKNRKIVDIVKKINLEVEFLREDCTPEDFIDVLTGASEKDIYLNIDNRNFHYLLTKIGEYFFNFSFTAVAKTNKIHSKRGTLLKANNLNNAKVDYPSLKDDIDEVFKNFK
jgi:hypothetical protein